MRFKLKTAGNFYSSEDAERLKTFGFEFTPKQHDEPFNRFLYKSGPKDDLTIDIATLEELMAFVKEWGDIVLGEDSILIYDDYLD